MKVPISKPLFGPEEMAAVQRPLETGWVVQGPYVAEFEQKFAAFTGVKYALATTSCTTALHAALLALDVGPGDEVIVPALTWVATANVVEMVGARPVLVDVDLATFNVDPDQMARAVTPRTKALLPVSLFGLSAPLDPILEIARRHGLKVIEDTACAVGALYHGRHAGTRVDAGCFSFHPRKAITTGEGGMVTTNDATVAARVASLRDHGASTTDLARHSGSQPYLLPEFHILGFNYRMTDIQGAVGSVQMDRLPDVLKQRQRIAARYDAALANVDWLRPPVVPEGCRHGYQSYVCLYQPERPTRHNVAALHAQRNQLMKALQEAGVSTRPGTHAVHMLAYYSRKYGYRPETFPQAWFADQLTISLPLYAQMTEAEQQHVIEQLVTLGRKLPVGS